MWVEVFTRLLSVAEVRLLSAVEVPALRLRSVTGTSATLGNQAKNPPFYLKMERCAISLLLLILHEAKLLTFASDF
jgi:hypothetical protein